MQIFYNIVKISIFFFNFVVPNKTFRVSPVFPLFQDICVVQTVVAAVFASHLMTYWVTITLDIFYISFHDHYFLRLHNHLRKSRSYLIELDIVIEREKGNTKKQQYLKSCYILEILTAISFLEA